jgi:hypothetical protein
MQPFLEKMQKPRLDEWVMRPSAEIDAALNPLIEWIDKVSGTGERDLHNPHEPGSGMCYGLCSIRCWRRLG